MFLLPVFLFLLGWPSFSEILHAAPDPVVYEELGGSADLSELFFGDRVSVFFEDASEVYTWRIDADAGTRLTLSSQTDFDSYLRLLDESGHVVVTADDADASLSASIYDVYLLEGGMYTVELSSRFGTGVASLALVRTDSPVEEGVLKLDSIQTRMVSSGGSKWRLAGEAGRFLTVRATAEKDPVVADSFIQLYDPSGHLLVQDDDGGNGYDSEIRRFHLLSSGMYTIIVRNLNSDPAPVQIQAFYETEPHTSPLVEGKLEL